MRWGKQFVPGTGRELRIDPRLRKEEGFVRDETAPAPSQRTAPIRSDRPDFNKAEGRRTAEPGTAYACET